MPQIATLTLPRKPIPASSYFVKSTLKPKMNNVQYFQLITRVSQKRLRCQLMLSKDDNDRKFQKPYIYNAKINKFCNFVASIISDTIFFISCLLQGTRTWENFP